MSKFQLGDLVVINIDTNTADSDTYSAYMYGVEVPPEWLKENLRFLASWWDEVELVKFGLDGTYAIVLDVYGTGARFKVKYGLVLDINTLDDNNNLWYRVLFGERQVWFKERYLDIYEQTTT